MNRALKEGEVSLCLIKCLCQGPPRVGKTHVKGLLLGRVINDSSSTACAEHPELAFRNVSSEKYKVSTKNEEMWELMDSEMMKSLIVTEMEQLTGQEGEEQEETENDFRTIEEPNQGLEQESSAHILVEEFKHRILTDSDRCQTTSNQEWIYFIDSGGQPQFRRSFKLSFPIHLSFYLLSSLLKNYPIAL